MSLNLNRRHFLKSSAMMSAGVALFTAPQTLAQTFISGLVTQVNRDRDDKSIETISLSQTSSLDFNGDNIDRPHDILWDVDGYVSKKGGWPEPSQTTDIVVVGGGMSGLLSAYLLKDQKPILLEQDKRVGGNSRGEIYNKSMYSIGAAYITVPDEGSTIEQALTDLELLKQARHEADQDLNYFFKNEFIHGFWSGATDPSRASDFIAVANELKRIYDEEYPDIPWTSESALSFERWKELDQISFEAWLKEKWPNVHPHILEYFQLYGWSSFNASIDELSALQMLNFVTSETGGILAFPAGNSLITYKLHEALKKSEAPVESGAFVLRVQTQENGVRVTFEDSHGELKAIQCQRCVIAAPKYVANKIVPELSSEQKKKISKISYRGYIVANIILNKQVPSVGFDVYTMLGMMPEAPSAMKPSSRAFSDVCFGSWAQSDNVDESILTLYKPLPFDGARQFLFNPMAHDKTKKQIMPELEIFLAKMGLSTNDIKGIRLTRWGHSIPIAHKGLLASGDLDVVNEPIKNKIFFANQDNFANPAFETSFAAAEIVAEKIRNLL